MTLISLLPYSADIKISFNSKNRRAIFGRSHYYFYAYFLADLSLYSDISFPGRSKFRIFAELP